MSDEKLIAEQFIISQFVSELISAGVAKSTQAEPEVRKSSRHGKVLCRIKLEVIEIFLELTGLDARLQIELRRGPIVEATHLLIHDRVLLRLDLQAFVAKFALRYR